LASEFQRIKAGKKMPPVDRSRYEPNPPMKHEQGNIDAWTRSIEIAMAQHNHHCVRFEMNVTFEFFL